MSAAASLNGLLWSLRAPTNRTLWLATHNWHPAMLPAARLSRLGDSLWLDSVTPPPFCSAVYREQASQVSVLGRSSLRRNFVSCALTFEICTNHLKMNRGLGRLKKHKSIYLFTYFYTIRICICGLFNDALQGQEIVFYTASRPALGPNQPLIYLSI
jgi:hypothetical protein